MSQSDRRRLLVLAFDPITDAMPGPAIRAWHLAGELSRDHDVVLATTSVAQRTHPAMDVRSVSAEDLEPLVAWADAVIAPTSVVRRHEIVARSQKPLCIDMYIPTHLENLEPLGDAGGEDHVAAVAHQVAVINEDLRRGDFFLCASERQRDFWLGSLASLGRLNPKTYADDPTGRRLIDVVPFGVPDDPPVPGGNGARAAFPTIGPDDPLLIWGGGVYNWFDPLSLLHAVDQMRSRIPNVRLVFLGMLNPNPNIPQMRVASDLRRLADDLAMTGVNVFFKEGWVPYEDRGGFLLDADVGVSTHLGHLETHFSFRTRVLDYLWAGLPMVLTAGDALSEEIEAHGLGVAVAPGDPTAIAAALEQLIDNPPSHAAVRTYARRYHWNVVARPLLDYCRDPWLAADRYPLDPVEPVATPRARVPASPVVKARGAAGRVRRALRARS